MLDKLEDLAETISHAIWLARAITGSQGYKRVPKIISILHNALDETLDLQAIYEEELD